MTSLTDPFPTLEQLPAIDPGVYDPMDVRGNDTARQRARTAGHAEGFAQGYADGRAAASEDLAGDLSFALTALHGAIEDLARRDAAGLESLQREATELALAIAREVIGREVLTADNPGADALARALRFAPDRGVAVARLHPDDLELISTSDRLATGRDVELIADRSVERGGCILDVGPARIDAQLTPALERIRTELEVA